MSQHALCRARADALIVAHTAHGITDISVPSCTCAYLSGHGAGKEVITEQPLG